MKSLVFIGGLHRSGTSPLCKVLSEHPGASGFPGSVHPIEGQFLQSVYPTGNAYGGPGRFGLDPAAHLTECSALATPVNRAQLLSQWEARWDMTKAVLIEKSPPNLLKMRLLQSFFPEATFVVLIRHPIAVTLATKKLWGGEIDQLLDHWLTSHDLFMADASHIANLIVVRYEELVTDSTLLGHIQAAIGLRPAMGEGYFTPGLNEPYFEQWISEASEIDHCANAEERTRRFGYSLAEPHFNTQPASDFERLLMRWRDE